VREGKKKIKKRLKIIIRGEEGWGGSEHPTSNFER
jgi:hypothetical protein